MFGKVDAVMDEARLQYVSHRKFSLEMENT